MISGTVEKGQNEAILARCCPGLNFCSPLLVEKLSCLRSLFAPVILRDIYRQANTLDSALESRKVKRKLQRPQK